MGLEKLLYLQGVGAEFIDCFGNNIRICPEDRNGILKAMCANDLNAQHGSGSALLSEAYINERIHELDAKPWLIPLHHFQWSYVDEPVIYVNLARHFVGRLHFNIVSEQGDTYCFQIHSNQLLVCGDYTVNSTTYLKYQYQLSLEANIPIGLGYHQVTLSIETDNFNQQFTGSLMLAPREAFCGAVQCITSDNCNHDSHHSLKNSNHKLLKPWGISTQLYSLKTEGQWGFGDFKDLEKLIDYIAKQGADFILLNPLHALDLPDNISPYSPSDRRRLNPLYIHIESVDEYTDIADVVESSDFQKHKAKLRDIDLLNYADVFEIKNTVFRLLFDAFVTKSKTIKSHQYQHFNAYKRQESESLVQFVEHQIGQVSPGFLTRIDADTYEANFICYLQFIAAKQLSLCQLKAKSVGMLIGLVRDMAVGASPHGAEVKQNKGYFCQHASIGAPPDPFAPQGQNWGLTPLDPIRLQQKSYQHFITLIRSNMQSCGGLRIDHVMGLLRLWWWPANSDNGNGAYVYYPLDTLLAILCLESQRAQCVLIGEDLGIVPPEIVQRLSKAKIFSNELFYFAKNHHGFMAPEGYKSHSLMMLANHDVPTLCAWWNGDDIRLRHQLELIDNSQQQEAINTRVNEKQQLIDLLKEKHLLLANNHVTATTFEQVLPAWLSLTASGESRLYSVQLDDLINETKPINIPGTWKEYPNWQRRLSLNLEQIVTSGGIKHTLQIVNKARNKPSHSNDNSTKEQSGCRY